jgi:hypothetical protein
MHRTSIVKSTQDPVPGFRSTQDPMPGHIAISFFDPDDGCGNNINWLQLLLKHHRGPHPPWATELSNVLQCTNQFFATSFITNEALAEQARADAMKNLSEAAEKLSSSVKAKVSVAA